MKLRTLTTTTAIIICSSPVALQVQRESVRERQGPVGVPVQVQRGRSEISESMWKDARQRVSEGIHPHPHLKCRSRCRSSIQIIQMPCRSKSNIFA